MTDQRHPEDSLLVNALTNGPSASENPDTVHAHARRALRVDFAIAAILFVATVAAFIWFDFFEWFFEYSRQHEDWELDELTASIPAFAIATAWFAIRRWRYSLRISSELESSLRRLMVASENLALTHDRAEQASHVKSVFLSMMSDEIRTPMNGIVQPIKSLLASDLNTGQRADATRVLQSSGALLRSINDILELAALETGPITVADNHIEIDNLLHDIETFFSEHDRGNLELSFYVDPVLPETIVTDQRRLMQILSNLLGNALKFTSTGGVAIAIRLAASPGESFFVRFEIRDTGPGIAAEHTASIFENFSKPVPQDQQGRAGIGVGLPICRKLVTYLGGEIGVESKPGFGSTFWFTLPLSSKSTPLNVRANRLLSGLSVLVVDDLELNRDMIEAQISDWGATVKTVAFGIEAMALLRTAAEQNALFDVALLDHSTSPMNAFDIAAQARDDFRMEKLKLVIYETGTISDSASLKGLPNVAAFLKKPVHPLELKNCLLKIQAAQKA